MKKMALTVLLLLLITCFGCSGNPKKSPPVNLFGKWQKVDNAEVTIEFTKGGSLFFNDGNEEYTTTYNYGSDPILRVNIVSFDIQGWFQSNDKYQNFRREVLPSGELLLVTVVGKYQKKEIIKQMTGRYVQVKALEKETSSSSDRVISSLADMRLKSLVVSTKLSRLKSDRDKLVKSLRKAGIKNADDLSDNSSARLLAEELTEVAKQIAQTEALKDKYDEVISQLELAKRRLERRESNERAGLKEADIAGIDDILKEVNEKLGQLAGDAIEEGLTTEVVLEKELNKKKP